jgi:O-antigen/teichoic acid export membrane protein
MDIIRSIQSGLNNKNIRFIFFRYSIYVVQFITALFIAKNLGPYFLGEWGFMMLVIQYLTQINFGIPNALNVKLATYEGRNFERQNQYFGNSLMFTFLHSTLILILLLLALFINVPIFDKYDFYRYMYLVAFIAIIQNLDVLFIHALRVKNLLKPIGLYQAVMPVTGLIVCFFWKGEELLYALLLSQLVGYLLSFIVFIYYSPVKLELRPKLTIQKDLLKTGMALLLYSASFYFIMIITRTFVSYFFSVKDLGYFSFALSFSQATFLALDTISFLIFPKLINRLKYKEGDELFKKIEYVRSNYNLIAFLLIFCTIILFPVILIFIPGYSDSFKSFTLLSISLALVSGNFGIATLFISSGKEFLLSRIALTAFIINFILVWIISSNSSTYYMLCFAPLITYIIYSCLLGYFYNLIFLKKKNIQGLFSNLDARLVFPALILVIAVMLNNLIAQAFAYLTVILLNWRRIKGLLPVLNNFINNPSLFKI